MHPTPEEQLEAIRRLIDLGARDSGETEAAGPDVAPSPLDVAARLVRKLGRSWAARMPFLVRDNELAGRLLSDLAPLLPSLAEEISLDTRSLPARSESAAHDTNKRLQDLLARAVHALPDDRAGDEARARIAGHLRHRLAADPALNREPTVRPEPEVRLDPL